MEHLLKVAVWTAGRDETIGLKPAMFAQCHGEQPADAANTAKAAGTFPAELETKGAAGGAIKISAEEGLAAAVMAELETAHVAAPEPEMTPGEIKAIVRAAQAVRRRSQSPSSEEKKEEEEQQKQQEQQEQQEHHHEQEQEDQEDQGEQEEQEEQDEEQQQLMDGPEVVVWPMRGGAGAAGDGIGRRHVDDDVAAAAALVLLEKAFEGKSLLAGLPMLEREVRNQRDGMPAWSSLFGASL